MNRILVTGRFAHDPELRTTPEGVNVTSFRLAVNRSYDHNKVDWLNFVAWRQNAEFICKYFKKGKPITIEGTLQSRTYTDKQGEKNTVHEILVEKSEFALTEQRTAAIDAASDFEGYEEIEDDDLPFNQGVPVEHLD